MNKVFSFHRGRRTKFGAHFNRRINFVITLKVFNDFEGSINGKVKHFTGVRFS